MDRPLGGTGITGTSSTETTRGTGMGTGSGAGMGSGMGSGTGLSTGSGVCATCGQSLGSSRGLEQFLGKLGISEEMINNLRTQMQNVDVEEYLNTARDYVKSSSEKAKSFTKENPGKVAAGVAVLAVGAGLLISALNRD
jgi:hypothetical protein